MLILYVLSVLSFLALAWAAISITRHIRRNSALPPTPSDAQQDTSARPDSTPVTLAGARRNPVSTRTQSDWANLEKSIGGHELGNTSYPRAPRRNPPTKHGA